MHTKVAYIIITYTTVLLCLYITTKYILMKGTVSVKVFWKMLQWIQALCFKLMMKGPISHHLFIKMCHKNISLKPNKIFSLHLPPSPLFHANIKELKLSPRILLSLPSN